MIPSASRTALSRSSSSVAELTTTFSPTRSKTSIAAGVAAKPWSTITTVCAGEVTQPIPSYHGGRFVDASRAPSYV